MVTKHIGLTLIAGIAVGYAAWKVLPPVWTPIQTAGLILLAIGFPLWTIARFQLGDSFAVTAQARQLVTHGIYSKLRNPIYVFGSCIIAGVFLLIGRPKYLLIFVIVIPMQILRARKEAAVLEAKFGDEYRAYRASTWL
jgi:protein-S-isoprenylcysteine O-methyltransferase Ste14